MNRCDIIRKNNLRAIFRSLSDRTAAPKDDFKTPPTCSCPSSAAIVSAPASPITSKEEVCCKPPPAPAAGEDRNNTVLTGLLPPGGVFVVSLLSLLERELSLLEILGVVAWDVSRDPGLYSSPVTGFRTNAAGRLNNSLLPWRDNDKISFFT